MFQYQCNSTVNTKGNINGTCGSNAIETCGMTWLATEHPSPHFLLSKNDFDMDDIEMDDSTGTDGNTRKRKAEEDGHEVKKVKLESNDEELEERMDYYENWDVTPNPAPLPDLYDLTQMNEDNVMRYWWLYEQPEHPHFKKFEELVVLANASVRFDAYGRFSQRGQQPGSLWSLSADVVRKKIYRELELADHRAQLATGRRLGRATLEDWGKIAHLDNDSEAAFDRRWQNFLRSGSASHLYEI